MKGLKITQAVIGLVVLCIGFLTSDSYSAPPKPGVATSPIGTAPHQILKVTDVKIDNVYTTSKTECACPCPELDGMGVFMIDAIKVFISNAGSNPANGTIKVSYTSILNNSPVTMVKTFNALTPSSKADFDFGAYGLIRKSPGVKIEVVLSGEVTDNKPANNTLIVSKCIPKPVVIY